MAVWAKPESCNFCVLREIVAGGIFCLLYALNASLIQYTSPPPHTKQLLCTHCLPILLAVVSDYVVLCIIVEYANHCMPTVVTCFPCPISYIRVFHSFSCSPFYSLSFLHCSFLECASFLQFSCSVSF